MRTKLILKTRQAVLCAFLTLITVGLAVYPQEISSAVRDALLRCINVLIPSLFAFMTAADMLTRSGSAELISRPFRPAAKYIFRMPCSIFTVFLISIFAGYPVGIKTISDMLDRGELNKETAEKAACFCYCGGPAFYSGAVGLTVFGDKNVGKLIFLSVLISNMFTAFLLCRISELTAETVRSNSKKGSLLVTSVRRSGRSMCLICLTVIFFSALLELIRQCGVFSMLQHVFGLSENAVTLISSLIEITALTELKGSPYKLLPYICAVCSFGGICIIVQLFALKSDRLSLLRFIELRPLNAVFSAVICKILQPYVIKEVVPALSYNNFLLKTNNCAASICLILMIFLLNCKKTLLFSDRV